MSLCPAHDQCHDLPACCSYHNCLQLSAVTDSLGCTLPHTCPPVQPPMRCSYCAEINRRGPLLLWPFYLTSSGVDPPIRRAERVECSIDCRSAIKAPVERGSCDRKLGGDFVRDMLIPSCHLRLSYPQEFAERGKYWTANPGATTAHMCSRPATFSFCCPSVTFPATWNHFRWTWNFSCLKVHLFCFVL